MRPQPYPIDPSRTSAPQHRFNQAFAATARSVVPTSVFDSDRLLDTPGVTSMAPAPTSAAAQQAMSGTRRPGAGDPADDPSRPDATGTSFKEQIHKVCRQQA